MTIWPEFLEVWDKSNSYYSEVSVRLSTQFYRPLMLSWQSLKVVKWPPLQFHNCLRTINSKVSWVHSAVPRICWTTVCMSCVTNHLCIHDKCYTVLLLSCYLVKWLRRQYTVCILLKNTLYLLLFLSSRCFLVLSLNFMMYWPLHIIQISSSWTL